MSSKNLDTGFAQIPNAIARDPHMLKEHFRVWVQLKSYAYGKKMWANPSLATITEETGYSESRLKILIAEMEKLGYLAVKRERGHRNHYVLTIPNGDGLAERLETIKQERKVRASKNRSKDLQKRDKLFLESNNRATMGSPQPSYCGEPTTKPVCDAPNNTNNKTLNNNENPDQNSDAQSVMDYFTEKYQCQYGMDYSCDMEKALGQCEHTMQATGYSAARLVEYIDSDFDTWAKTGGNPADLTIEYCLSIAVDCQRLIAEDQQICSRA
jgi:hypothetical protein